MGQPVMQFQILSKNPDKSEQFYGNLFGWKINRDNALGYRQIDTQSEHGISGGIWPAPPEGHGLVQLFIEVEDVAEATRRASDLGAQILIEPQVLPDGDEMAVLVDPEGIAFGMTKLRGTT